MPKFRFRALLILEALIAAGGFYVSAVLLATLIFNPTPVPFERSHHARTLLALSAFALLTVFAVGALILTSRRYQASKRAVDPH
jgi:hypothetical protein